MLLFSRPSETVLPVAPQWILCLLLLGAFGALVTGCRIGRFHYAHSGTYNGTVLDAETKATIAGAKLELVSTLNSSSKTDSRGHFSVGPLECSHFGVAFLPEATTFTCKHSVGANLLLRTSKSGYESGEILVPANYDVTNWSNGSGLDVGKIFLHRQSAVLR